MNKEIIVQKLKAIKDLLEKNSLESLPEIDKDIILRDLQDIYSTIKFSLYSQEISPASKHAEASPEITSKAQEDLLEIDAGKPEEPVMLSESEQPLEVKESIPQKSAGEDKRQSHSQKTLADLYGKKTPLINEMLAEKMRKKDLSSVLQSKPIDSLEHAIDINAKFLFVRELFFNNMQLFEKTIRIIDSAATFNDAFNYLQQQFIWNYESEVVQRFLELVRRRFIKDEA
ncbi:MAG: hypothetical protein ACP5PS_01465 [Bacteroidales bacterium]